MQTCHTPNIAFKQFRTICRKGSKFHVVVSGTPNMDPKCYNSFYGDSQKVTPNFGNPQPLRILNFRFISYVLIHWIRHYEGSMAIQPYLYTFIYTPTRILINPSCLRYFIGMKLSPRTSFLLYICCPKADISTLFIHPNLHVFYIYLLCLRYSV